MEKTSSSFSSGRSSPKFFTNTLVNILAFSPSSFSLSFLGTNLPTNTFFSLSNIPLTFWIAFLAASSVSKWTNP